MKRRSQSALRARARRSATAAREGFSLLEVLIALIGMSVAMIGLAGMLVVASRAATQVSTRSSRGAELTEQLNYLATLPYADLESRAGCVFVNQETFPHTRCIAVTTVTGGSGAKQIQLIISPVNTAVKPDTTYMTRSIGKQANPLGT